MTTLESLEARVRCLEDIEAIRRLKARYAHLCDQKYRLNGASEEQHLDAIAQRIAELFTPDAVWDGGARFGVTRGRQEIFERFRRKTFLFAFHYFVMPDISVHGDEATGLWYLLQPATLTTGAASWIAGTERDGYRRLDGHWLMSRLTVDLAFMAPYDEGWAKKNLIG